MQVGTVSSGLGQIAQATGAKFYILAFVEDDSRGGCQANWSGTHTPIEQSVLATDIRKTAVSVPRPNNSASW